MFLVYFLIYLFIEVMISSNVAGAIGGLFMFLEIIISAIVGISLLKSIPEVALSNITSVFNGNMDGKEFVRLNLIMAIGAVLIIVPGIFTDILGILLQFNSFGMLVLKKLNKPVNNTNFTKGYENNETIIDVEIIDHKHDSDK